MWGRVARAWSPDSEPIHASRYLLSFALSTFYRLCYATIYHAHIQYIPTQALSLFVALPVSSLKIAEFYPFSAILLFEDLCHSLVQLLPICLPSLINKELQIIWSYLRLVSASHFALPHDVPDVQVIEHNLQSPLPRSWRAPWSSEVPSIVGSRSLSPAKPNRLTA